MTKTTLECAHRKVALAARAIARAGLSGPYGHCSMRIDEANFLVCAAKPLSLIQPGDQGTIAPIVGELPLEVLGEVRVHQQIYARRPLVNGVVRFLSPKILSLSAAGKAPGVRHGFGAYFAPGAAFWSDTELMRSDATAAAVGAALGDGRGIVLRGNGAIVAGDTLEQAVTLAWYLEDAARVELDLLHAGLEQASQYSPAEAVARATWGGRIAERMWDHLTFDNLQ